eukprot:IDg20641t1
MPSVSTTCTYRSLLGSRSSNGTSSVIDGEKGALQHLVSDNLRLGKVIVPRTDEDVPATDWRCDTADDAHVLGNGAS